MHQSKLRRLSFHNMLICKVKLQDELHKDQKRGFLMAQNNSKYGITLLKKLKAREKCE